MRSEYQDNRGIPSALASSSWQALKHPCIDSGGFPMLRRFSALFLFKSSLFLLSIAVLPAHGQDARTVTEPVIPTVCSVHTAEIASTNGDLNSTNNAHFDTARI